jgi:hypothetical protein
VRLWATGEETLKKLFIQMRAREIKKRSARRRRRGCEEAIASHKVAGVASGQPILPARGFNEDDDT